MTAEETRTGTTMADGDRVAPVEPVNSTVPQRLGRYEIIGELARGGMGIVYLARHSGEAGFKRLFALKVLHRHLSEDESFVSMLHDEARIASRLHHPNVVPIVDLGTQDELHYVVMEYVEGVALSRLLSRGRSLLSAELVVSIVIDTLEGLHAAHTLSDHLGNRLNLVHRDVSPQNILVGVDGSARITDFGIAKAEANVTATMPGNRKGKVAYMAPEQMLDDSDDVDRRADVFAAGTVLWSALTGAPLFRAESDVDTLNNVLFKAIPPPSQAGVKPPPMFDEVCLRALEREPDRRFQSALEMAEALREIAIQNRMLVSRARVAEWVLGIFRDELEQRRATIRDAARRRDLEGADVSTALTQTDRQTPTALPETTLADTSSSVGSDTGKTRHKKTAALIGGAVASLSALGIAIWLLARPSSHPPDEAIEATPSESANASPPPPSATGALSTNLEPTAPAPTESGASSEPAHSVPSAPSRTRSKARPRGQPKGNDRTRTPPSAASTPAGPRPRDPNREPQIERNPYVRRK